MAGLCLRSDKLVWVQDVTGVPGLQRHASRQESKAWLFPGLLGAAEGTQVMTLRPGVAPGAHSQGQVTEQPVLAQLLKGSPGSPWAGVVLPVASRGSPRGASSGVAARSPLHCQALPRSQCSSTGPVAGGPSTARWDEPGSGV